MPRGYFSVLRYIPDRARNEPINIGVMATGPSGAHFVIPQEAIDRIPPRDPYVDKGALAHIEPYIERLVKEPIVEFRDGSVVETHPFMPGYLESLSRQLGQHLILSEPHFVELADESDRAVEEAIKDLVARLVTPLKGQPRFVERDPAAPVNILKASLSDLIGSRRLLVEPEMQGWSRRLRRPDFAYYTDDGSVVLVNVKLDYKTDHNLLSQADAKAFEIYDMSRDPRREVVALLQPPLVMHEAVDEALKSIRAVTENLIDGRNEQQLDDLKVRVRREAVVAA